MERPSSRLADFSPAVEVGDDGVVPDVKEFVDTRTRQRNAVNARRFEGFHLCRRVEGRRECRS